MASTIHYRTPEIRYIELEVIHHLDILEKSRWLSSVSKCSTIQTDTNIVRAQNALFSTNSVMNDEKMLHC